MLYSVVIIFTLAVMAKGASIPNKELTKAEIVHKTDRNTLLEMLVKMIKAQSDKVEVADTMQGICVGV